MSRRIQCRALFLALVLCSAHAASSALHAAPASRRPDSSVDRRSFVNLLLPSVTRFLDRVGFLGLLETKDGPPPNPLPPTGSGPHTGAGPAVDPNGAPGH